MKKKVLFSVALVAFLAIGLFSYARVSASKDCPNGCKPCGDLCVCNGDHYHLSEAGSVTAEQLEVNR